MVHISRRYINEMTLETNKLIGLDNMRLTWKGPYERHDFQEKYPGNPSYVSTIMRI